MYIEKLIFVDTLFRRLFIACTFLDHNTIPSTPSQNSIINNIFLRCAIYQGFSHKWKENVIFPHYTQLFVDWLSSKNSDNLLLSNEKKYFTVTNLSGALWVNWLFLIWCRPFAGSNIHVTHILQYYKNQIYNTELA
jgi:hypothetical protein